jgi:hypothetical protein
MLELAGDRASDDQVYLRLRRQLGQEELADIEVRANARIRKLRAHKNEN